MRVPRIHTINPLSETQTAALDDKGIKHIRDVLRLNVGHHVILFNGDGYDYHGEITELHKRNVLIQIKDKILVECESPLSLHLLQPLCRSDKMDWCLQKATELGVNSITPFISSRVNLNLSHNKIHKKINHWQSVIHSACEQCGRASIPEINAPMDYQTLVASLPEDACKIIANPYADENSDTEIPFNYDRVICAVGPEGGFSPEEIQFSQEHGFNSQRLGPRILRLETAVVSLLTITQAQCGDLN
jgi:16S rRNA (uracil1498-N3)-methyltransferase